jgi:hypothetical protein
VLPPDGLRLEEGRVLGINKPVVVAGRRRAAGGLIVSRKVLRSLRAERDRLGSIEDDGAGLLEQPDVLMEGDATGEYSGTSATKVLVRLVHGAHVVPAPGLGLL